MLRLKRVEGQLRGIQCDDRDAATTARRWRSRCRPARKALDKAFFELVGLRDRASAVLGAASPGEQGQPSRGKCRGSRAARGAHAGQVRLTTPA
ncbi:MAG: metal-sensitive transcriptional regulator [Comamonadaceae bacterium]|nr:metal-sensitive transcriptional regulator [Comamonadaceae bacterium]